MIFVLDSEPSYTDKLLEFRGVQIAPVIADNRADSFSHGNQAVVIKAYNSTSRYLDDLLNIDNPYFEGMVEQIYPPELKLNKANTIETEAPFLDLHLSIANGFLLIFS